jgi:hypothetical protein
VQERRASRGMRGQRTHRAREGRARGSPPASICRGPRGTSKKDGIAVDLAARGDGAAACPRKRQDAVAGVVRRGRDVERGGAGVREARHSERF